MVDSFIRPDKNENRIKRLEASAFNEKTTCISAPTGGNSKQLVFYAGKVQQALIVSYWINGGTLTVSSGSESFAPTASAATVCLRLQKGNNTVTVRSSSGASSGQIIFEKTDLKE